MLRSVASKVAWVGRTASMVFGLALVLALVVGVASTALSATGDNFILGRLTNTAETPTALVSTLADAAKSALIVTNKSGGPALELRVGNPTTPANQVAPIKVNSNKVVTNLNADKLDGKDSSAFQDKYAQTVVVAKSGGDFTSVQAALGSITDASNTKHYLVWVGPGTYNGRVQMKPFVDIEGAGELATRITASGGGGFGAGSSVVSGANNAELRHLTAENTGGGSTYAMGIFNGSASPRLSNVTATGKGADNNKGVVNAGSSPTMTDVSATADGGSTARGMENSTSSPRMTNVSVTASGGSTENTGVDNYLHSSPTIRESVISASGTNSYGVWTHFPDDTTSVVTIETSEVKGATGTVKAEDGYKVNVGASKLAGGAVSAIGIGSEVKCAGVHDENYVFSPSTCP